MKTNDVTGGIQPGKIMPHRSPISIGKGPPVEMCESLCVSVRETELLREEHINYQLPVIYMRQQTCTSVRDQKKKMIF